MRTIIVKGHSLVIGRNDKNTQFRKTFVVLDYDSFIHTKIKTVKFVLATLG